MKKSRLSRRDFMRVLGVAAGTGVIGCGGGGRPDTGGGTPPTPVPPPPTPVPPPPPSGTVIRPDVMSAEGQAMVEIYSRAVGIMRGRAESVATSWLAQANIHLNWCPHGNAFFLPWHRAYLHYFEEIIRDAAGDPTFALPYWNWTTHPTIPDAFWEGPLNDDTRQIRPGQPIPPRYVGPNVISDILDITDFETFASAYVDGDCSPSSDGKEQRASCGTGRLEGTPHNNVHVEVGGRRPPVGNMSTFVSPRDPIFWLHHCNVDRLWATWNLRHANGTNADWSDFEFQDNFVNPQGAPQSITVSQTFKTADLGYTYDTIPAAAPEAALTGGTATVVAQAEAANTAQARAGSPIRISVDLGDELRARMRALTGPAPEGAGRPTVRLTIGGIEHPENAVPVNVYVGPAEAPTGGEASPSYVGTFSFFPIGEGSHAGSTSFLFDIGKKLAGGSGFDASGPLHVHVEPQALAAGAAPEAAPTTITPSLIRVEIIDHG